MLRSKGPLRPRFPREPPGSDLAADERCRAPWSIDGGARHYTPNPAGRSSHLSNNRDRTAPSARHRARPTRGSLSGAEMPIWSQNTCYTEKSRAVVCCRCSTIVCLRPALLARASARAPSFNEVGRGARPTSKVHLHISPRFHSQRRVRIVIRSFRVRSLHLDFSDLDRARLAEASATLRVLQARSGGQSRGRPVLQERCLRVRSLTSNRACR